ncbi:hydantoinase [Verticillium alfalfae VaMs.102]|uniref:Hydantoinase n=1 Tax=Verticillium alfalfae (strain VaMs.102 / ATCC MYA-4576 / FGSC 10136) TaxID=526221 RepID=C9SCZ0_VERA1|nr:hydantoinase [Verticillium alfalfae VaMs.102]EEY16955.1 hydantoinase [Verticillium alfalfae VaMs.102]
MLVRHHTAPLYRVGVDVGGTNTDAAILDITSVDTPDRGVLASHKASTTPDISSGIEAAIRAILQNSAVDQTRVLNVTIGTTHFINALVEADARRLSRVAVVRLCGAFTRQIPPFSDFPAGLRRVLDGGAHYLDGGLEIDGREIAPLGHDQIRQVARDILASGVRSVALVGIFAPLDHAGVHEEMCKRILLETAPELDVVCSHDIGPPGFLERENATVLNAAILRTARKVTSGFKAAMSRLNLACPLYLSQNDGTLIDADAAAEYPIKTFASGPTNSMTGAAFLAGLDQTRILNSASSGETPEDDVEPQVLVVDIGGTTTDVCALLPSGFPRQAPGFVEVGGVRTAFSMPEVVSIGLGGGSKVHVGSDPATVTVGPGSVGHFLKQQALAFGGTTLTTTDIVVAMGKAKFGDRRLIENVPISTIDAARRKIKKMIEGVVEQMKVSAAPVHILLVGGGALLVTEDLDGVAKCIQPVHQGAANAVGAAIGKISGEVDVIEILQDRDEKEVVAAACQKAIDQAISKGAAADDVSVVEINKIPLQYVDNGAMRIQIRAVGKLAVPKDGTLANSVVYAASDEEEEEQTAKANISDALESTFRPSIKVDLETYRPEVRNGAWYVSEVDLELIATGCGVLGTGGGGPTHHEFLKSLDTLRKSEPGRLRIISPKSVKDDDLICFGSWYGSPSVINERIASGDEIPAGIDALMKILGKDKPDGIFTDEMCAMFFLLAVLNVLTSNLATLSVYGHPLTPCALSDARGNVNIVMNTDTPFRLEKLLRTAAIELGLGCAVAARPLPGSAIKAHGVPNTLSQAWYLGRAVHLARRNKTSFIDAIFAQCAGKLLFTGKIIDVRRFVGDGYTMGSVLIAPLADEELDSSKVSSLAGLQATSAVRDRHMLIPFQNEYLYAALTDGTGSEEGRKVICTVPDLISILGQDGEAIGSQDLRYGLRVSVIGLPAHPLWKTEKAMPIGGPAAFGLNMPFVGAGEYGSAKSVLEEFEIV